MSESPDASKNEAYSSEPPKSHTSDSVEDNKSPENIEANQPIRPVYYAPDPEPLPEPSLSKPPLTNPPVTNLQVTNPPPTTTRTATYNTASKDDDNITNVLSNVVAPAFLGGLGAVGLMAIGLNAPTKEVQVTSEDGTTNTTTVAKDYLPSLSMGAGAEFFLYSCVVVMLATIIGSIGVLSLIGVPKKSERAKTWQIGIVYALLFPTAISALIQNQFLGGQQASVESRLAAQQSQSTEQNAGSLQSLQAPTIETIQQELQAAHKQLRLSTQIIAAPQLFSFPQQNVVSGNQESIANLDRLRRDLEEM